MDFILNTKIKFKETFIYQYRASLVGFGQKNSFIEMQKKNIYSYNKDEVENNTLFH